MADQKKNEKKNRGAHDEDYYTLLLGSVVEQTRKSSATWSFQFGLAWDEVALEKEGYITCVRHGVIREETCFSPSVYT